MERQRGQFPWGRIARYQTEVAAEMRRQYKYQTPKKVLCTYTKEERESWEVIIILPGVEIIPDYAFHECINVESVVMHESSVNSIGYGVFHKCNLLKFMKLSKNLRYIGKWSLSFCSSLYSIFIPESCQEIDEDAFHGCVQLLVFNVPRHTQIRDPNMTDAALFLNPIYKERKSYRARRHWYYNAVSFGPNGEPEECPVHRIFSTSNLNFGDIHTLVQEHGINAFWKRNVLGLTALQYLRMNPYYDEDVDEMEFIRRYIFKNIGTGDKLERANKQYRAVATKEQIMFAYRSIAAEATRKARKRMFTLSTVSSGTFATMNRKRRTG